MDTVLFACYNKMDNERKLSSSGGVYPLIARWVINKGGVIFAACYSDNFETVHKKIEIVEEIRDSQGSKYMPSNLGDTFFEIKKTLDKDMFVLFVGTPCQCAGLHKFLNNSDKEKLICIDFVCHGIPSKIAWRSYFSSITSDNSIIGLNMRDKSSGWSKYKYCWSISTLDGKTINIPQENVKYMKGFTQDLYLRPSCYECQFKGIERISDITLGDYWGVWDIQPNMDDNKGTSLVLIHSEKGKCIFNSIKDDLIWEKAPLAEAVRHNPSIVKSAMLTKKREKFFRELKYSSNFDEIINRLLKDTFMDKVKRRGKAMVRKLLGGVMSI